MKQRIVWLDSLKGFLILLVVVGHSIQEVGSIIFLAANGFGILSILST